MVGAKNAFMFACTKENIAGPLMLMTAARQVADQPKRTPSGSVRPEQTSTARDRGRTGGTATEMSWFPQSHQDAGWLPCGSQAPNGVHQLQAIPVQPQHGSGREGDAQDAIQQSRQGIRGSLIECGCVPSYRSSLFQDLAILLASGASFGLLSVVISHGRIRKPGPNKEVDQAHVSIPLPVSPVLSRSRDPNLPCSLVCCLSMTPRSMGCLNKSQGTAACSHPPF